MNDPAVLPLKLKFHQDGSSTSFFTSSRRSYRHGSPSTAPSRSELKVKPDHFGKKDNSEDDSDDGDGRISCPKKLNQMILRLQNLSLKAEVDPRGTYLISIDGYFRKDKGENGGYGAIMRAESGQPIVAVAGCSVHSISEFYHTLEGIKTGLALVENYVVDDFQISCNSDWVPWILRACFVSSIQGKCILHPQGTPEYQFDTFCIACLKRTMASVDFTHHNLNIMKEIVTMGKPNFRGSLITSFKRSWNRPADFLAKKVRTPGMEVTFAPGEFPAGLNHLLCEFGGKLPFILT